MDDAYIHAIYAENFARHHELAFNHGEFAGVGATSILWVLVLSAGCKLGLAPLLFSRILGILTFLVATQCVYKINKTLFTTVLRWEHAWAPFLATFFFACSGNMVWFCLSGMETMLFLSLGLVALVLYQGRQFVGMSIALALMTLTRTEGFLLAAILVTLYCLRTQRIGEGRFLAPVREWLQRMFPHHSRRWFPTAAIERAWARKRLDGNAKAARWRVAAYSTVFAGVVIPWFLFLFTSTGHALPTSFAGKKLSQMAATNYFISRGPGGSILVHLKPLIFLATWFFYTLLFVFGGVWLPGPTMTFHQVSDDLHLSFTGVAIFVMVLLPLLWIGVRQLLAALHLSIKESTVHQAVVALFVWFALHNIAYMVMFPSIGTTSRYQAVNHLIIWLVVTVGLYSLKDSGHRHAALAFRVSSMVVVFLSIAGLFFWRSVYHANLDHMVHSRIAAARYIDEHLPRNTVVAAHDIGAIKFYCNREVVDLGGLVDARFTDYQRRHALDEYLRQHHVQYLAIPGKHSTEKRPLYDFLAFLGLKKSSLYQLTEMASFENDHNLWALGNRPTGNYLPSVKIYAVRWRNLP